MEEVSLNSEPTFDELDDDHYNKDDVDSSNVAEYDDTNNSERVVKGHESTKPPTAGLEFDSFDLAYDFYNAYAKEQGFGIRVSNSWFRSKQKERYRAKLSCSSAGFKKKSGANNPRPETRTGCPAMVVIRVVESEIWRVVEVELQHNHPLTPQTNRFYKSHKKMVLAAKKPQPLPDPVMEMHTIKLYRTVDRGRCRDHHRSIVDDHHIDHHSSKHLELKEGDAQAMYNYFCRMKLTNPNFFYLMDFDFGGRLRNVFWADDRARVSSSYFSDTVALDTTCLINKYEIPLISLVGMNHHGQPVLLGCGFIGSESVENFVWIFRAWMKCMQGGCFQSPQVILTDQSKPLRVAVAEVFPEARHCNILCYLMQRVQERLGGWKGYEAMRKQLHKAVYSSLKISEFEASWSDMINHHGLGDNKWLKGLYEERQCWAPVYLKDVSFVGINPMKENETLAPFFDGYVNKHTSFKEFLDKYDLALHRRHVREATSDLKSLDSSWFEVRTRCSFEMQLSRVYTREMFERFQAEVEGMYSCFNTRQVNVEGQIATYVVKERVEGGGGGGEKEVRCYEVLYESSQVDIRCICSLFYYRGYLCRHALNVLNYNGVEEIPARYVLPRWTKDYKRRRPARIRDRGGEYSPVSWYKSMYDLAIPVVVEGSQCVDRYRIALQELQELLDKLRLIEDLECDT